MENKEIVQEYVERLVSYDSTIHPGYVEMERLISLFKRFAEEYEESCIRRILEEKRLADINYKRLRSGYDIQ